MMQVEDRHIVVLGGARSGLAAALLLKRKGAKPFLSDSGSLPEGSRERLTSEGIPFEENGHSSQAETGDFLIVSPGVPTRSSVVQRYLKSGKKVYSEIELASWFNLSPITAVTGTNGKTTVANWLAHTWKVAGRDHILAGNIGNAFSDQVEETSHHRDVLLEVSSFQLDHIDSFHPQTGIILNITKDHLDRYDNDFDQYAASKFRMTENQSAGDWFIYNAEDSRLRNHAQYLKNSENRPALMPFSSDREMSNGAFVRDGEIILKINQTEEPLMQISELGLSGKHNLQNGMATALAARANEIKNEFIRESLKTFEGVKHRLEEIRTVKGVRYINDSKATNVNAVWYALDSLSVPVVLILGGRDKGNDYTLLADQLRDKVHTVVAIGEAQKMVREQLASIVPNLEEAETMKKAVKAAAKRAKRGEAVLLSPACSSFDMFENYEARGEAFRQAVLEL
jgi:UDP-N-acetylmuramoylalanine--D-glutamate ligase